MYPAAQRLQDGNPLEAVFLNSLRVLGDCARAMNQLPVRWKTC